MHKNTDTFEDRHPGLFIIGSFACVAAAFAAVLYREPIVFWLLSPFA